MMVWIPPIVFSILIGRTYADGVPIQMTWSNKTYGPDGPWSALTVGVGNPPQQIDMFIGGLYSVRVIGATLCQNLPPGQICWAEEAGLYSPDKSNTSITGFDSSPNINTGNHIGNMKTTENAYSYVDQLTLGYAGETPLKNVSILDFEGGYGILPNSSDVPLTIGSFPIGGIVKYLKQGNEFQVNSSVPSSALYTNGVIPSTSFGLHIGSVVPYLTPSFWFGGYDKSRLLGTVATNTIALQGLKGKAPPQLSIDLLDIEIGMAPNRGPSPFESSTMSGLLAKGNNSIINSLQVQPDPSVAGLWLPQSTCEAITALLPVTYRSDLNLYTWRTEDDLYHRIVRSPSLLRFIFSNGGENVTISVPFMLLNLTLTPPLVSHPIPYFPCHFEGGVHYILGRSFLQSSFLGVNWEVGDLPGVFWLAQAPGPSSDRTPNVVPIGYSDQQIQSDTTADWYKTWDGYWQPLGPTGSGLSTGAEVGIGVGVGVACLLIIGGLTLFFVRRRKRKLRASEKVLADAKTADESSPSDSDGPGRASGRGNPSIAELAHSDLRAEMPENPVRHEMDAGHNAKVHLPGETLNPAEMEGEWGVHATQPTSSIQRTPIDLLHRADQQMAPIPSESQPTRQDVNRNTPSANIPTPQPTHPEPLSGSEKKRLWKRYNGTPRSPGHNIDRTEPSPSRATSKPPSHPDPSPPLSRAEKMRLWKQYNGVPSGTSVHHV